MVVAEQLGPLRHDRDRLHRDERQRPDLRRRRADRDARLHPLPRTPTPRSAAQIGEGLRARRRAGRDRDPRRRDRPGRRRRRGLGARPAARSGWSPSTRSSPATRIEPGDAADRPALLRPALQRLHARAQRRSPTSRSTTSASAGRWATSCSSRPRSTCAPCSSCSRSDVDVRGLAHITGDGLNNLLRLAARGRLRDRRPAAGAAGLRADRRAAARSPTTRCTRSSTWAAASAASSPRPTRTRRSSCCARHHPRRRRIGARRPTDAGVVAR